MELGYHVTLIKDATAAFSHEGMHAAHEVNGPTFAHAILTTKELLGILPAEQRGKSQFEWSNDKNIASGALGCVKITHSACDLFLSSLVLQSFNIDVNDKLYQAYQQLKGYYQYYNPYDDINQIRVSIDVNNSILNSIYCK